MGIGIATPVRKLDINGTLRIRALVTPPATYTTNDAVMIRLANGDVTGVNLTGNVNQVFRGDGTFGPSPGIDHDWYEVGTTTPPNNINDNIYTQGNVGIGTTAPAVRLHVISNTVAAVFQTTNAANLNIVEFRHPDLRWFFHVDAGNHAELGIYDASTALVRWNVLDIDRAKGNIGMGTDAVPTAKLKVQGNLDIRGDFRPNNNPGTAGQTLISQGPGTPPIWRQAFGTNTPSVSLTTTQTKTTSGWSDLLTLTVIPQYDKIIIFASFSARLTDNSGMAQYGQALVHGRILVNGTPVAHASSVITDFDQDYWGGNYVVTGGEIVFAGIPVTVIPGNTYTIKLQWDIFVLWASSPWQVRIQPGVGGDHGVLTILE